MKKQLKLFVALFFATILGANLFAQTVNMNKYITLTVTQGQQIQLDLKASAANTGVKVVSGSWDTTLSVGVSWTGFRNYTANASTMTIYGDVTYFDCSYNYSLLTNIDLSHNKDLVDLYCRSNQLTTLDVSGCTSLVGLFCYENELTDLDVSGCTSLVELDCYGNGLTSLDVSGLTSLVELDCYGNGLTSLDVSGCTSLVDLDCYENGLTSLDVSGLTQLKYLWLYNNNFNTQALDEIFCALAQRTSSDNAEIVVADSETDPVVLATNKSNATSKNWAVLYYDGSETSDFPETTGSHVCNNSTLLDVTDEEISFYPNPAKNNITIKGVNNKVVKIYDSMGRLVKQERINEKLNISDLTAGVYYIRINEITQKLIKE